MRRPPGWLRAAWESGELARAAQGAETWGDVARVLGVSKNALFCARDGLAKQGVVLSLFELANTKRSPPSEQCALTDAGVGSEQLNPAVPTQSFGASRWPSVEAFDARKDECLTPGRYSAECACGYCTRRTRELAREKPRTVADDITERRERAEISSLKSRLREAIDQLEQCRFELGIATQVDTARHDVAPIERREHSSGLREATACALASDWHIEERVDAAAVNGVNEYNLEIARVRAARFFAGFSYMTLYHADHFKIRDSLLWLGGDLITGYLREENLEHNELSPVQAIAELHVWIADGIRRYLNETPIERLKVVCNSGNHGRLTEKIRPATREANSIEWLLYVGLAREFAHEPRVEFVLPLGSQTYVSIYDVVIRFTHGDETKFGGGVGGIMIPIRKAIAKWQTVRSAHVNVIGHYHQEYFLRDLLVNGSLIGYNTYALSIAAPFEEPRQSFFLVDSQRGVSMPATLWVENARRAA